MNEETQEQCDKQFDFAEHGRRALAIYLEQQSFFEDLSVTARQIIEESCNRGSVRLHSISSRSKSPESFKIKAETPLEQNPNKAKYDNPLSQITDLAAARVITYFPKTIYEVETILEKQFVIVERTDKAAGLIESESFGYQSVHFLVMLGESRILLPEYMRFKDVIFEIQVRTILQHAWAEIEHDIQYKSAASIPRDIRRRFTLLAGLLEVADSEFQAIQDSDEELAYRAEAAIASGDLREVELTPRSLKVYLTKVLGPDGRMTDNSYDWEVRKLKHMGFISLHDVSECIQKYDDKMIGSLLNHNRQGQLNRFDDLLLAGMGEKYIEKHIFSEEEWYTGNHYRSQLKKLSDGGIEVGSYLPAHQRAASNAGLTVR